VRPVLQFLEQTYGVVAATGTDLPLIDDPSGPLTPFVALRDIPIWMADSQSFYAELERARGEKEDRQDGRVVVEPLANSGLPTSAQNAQNNFFQAYRFYYRPGSQRPDLPQNKIERSPKPHEFEFHEMLSSLADHPMLLRRLGLVIDLVVDIDPALVPTT